MQYYHRDEEVVNLMAYDLFDMQEFLTMHVWLQLV